MKELNELVELANKANVAGQGTPEMVEFRVVANPDNILAIAEAFRALEQELEKECDIHIDTLESMRHWKQRAEAAEAKVKELEEEQTEHDQQIATLQGKFDLALAGLRSKTERCEKAEVEIAAICGAAVPVYQYESGIYNEENGDTDWYWDDCDKGFYDQYDPSRRRILFTRPAPAASLAELVPDEWTNEQCLEFLSIAFRHAEISGDIEMDDIRLAVKMVNAAAPEVE